MVCLEPGQMQHLANLLLAVGAGLGVWMLTHISDSGFVDLAIVMGFVIAGALLKERET